MEILLILAVLILIGIVLKKISPKKKTSLKQYYNQEISIVGNNTYNKQKLLNKPETEVYWQLIKNCKSLNKGLEVFAQVNLGEILSNSDNRAYKAIMCKRIDFCITDKNFYPLAAIEYNGSGHYNATSDQRDKIKQQAVESANIRFVTLTPKNHQKELLDLFEYLD